MKPTSSPLSWPPGKPRTEAYKRQAARFGTGHTNYDNPRNFTIAKATQELEHELSLLHVPAFTLSTNLRLRVTDGLPVSNQAAPIDPGVALYFEMDGKETVFACDRWHKVQDNIFAIAKHIHALRGQDRWGVGTTAEAFAGYQALPPPSSSSVIYAGGEPDKPWRTVLELDDVRDDEITKSLVKLTYRALATKHQHDNTKLQQINLARDAALRDLKGRG